MGTATILISSCDGFSDCWGPYHHGLQRYWSDCPYDVYLVTNFSNFGQNPIKAIKVGEDKGWSNNTLRALQQIDAQYILYTHEDFWIKQIVSTSTISEYISLMDEDKADYIRLYPCPEPDYDCPWDKRLGILDENAPYRTSLQVALWRRNVLEDLIVEGENPWQFEILGSKRSFKYGSRFLSVKRFRRPSGDTFHYGIDYTCTAINKGKWSKAARLYALEEGLDIDFSKRPCETLWHDIARGRFALFAKDVITKVASTVIKLRKSEIS